MDTKTGQCEEQPYTKRKVIKYKIDYTWKNRVQQEIAT